MSIDTCRADALGVAGKRLADGSSPTPVIDGLALEGTWFPRAYSPVPLTLPAHATMFSGLYPDRHGVRENDSFKVPERKNRSYPLLAEELKAAGFETAAFVSGQPMERRFGLAAGFDVYDQPDPSTARGGGHRFRERPAGATAARAVAHLRSSTAGRRFVFVHFFDPHMPYEPEVRAPGLPPGDEGAYLGEVMACDRAIGEILAALPDGGRNAWVIVTADHGEGLGEHGEPTHGFLLYDSTLHVPLVIRKPRGSSAEVHPRLARLCDLAPTILEAAGLPAREADGRSLIGAPAGDAAVVDRAETLYGWYQFRYARLRAVRNASVKLIEGGSRAELYASDDPRETRDLAPEREAEVARMKRILLDALSSAPRGEAQSTFEVPDLAGPYIGGRPAGTALEPTEDENRRLPHVKDRWNVVTDLEDARAALRRGEPGRASLLLKAHEAERDDNPALLFWTARARHEIGASPAGSNDARIGELDAAAALYRQVRSRFGDPRGSDSELLVLRERHQITGDREDLRRLVRLADGEIAAGGGSSLTFALRGVARRDLGDLPGAERDLQDALRLDPGNARAASDLESVVRKLRD